jgi:uncharacterized protein
VQRWVASRDADLRRLGKLWQDVLSRNISWKMAAERAMYFHSGASEQTTIFSEPEVVEKRLRRKLPKDLRDIRLKVDIARHYHRPSTRLPAGGQNYVLDGTDDKPQGLNDYELFRELPLSFSICRVYAQDHANDAAIQRALMAVLGDAGDAKTNM